MNPRGLRRYIDDLLRGRRPKPFRPDDFEAAQIRTAIDLQAARLGSDAPRQEFLTDLRRRLAAQQDGVAQLAPKSGATRRNVIVGTSAAAAAAVAAVSIDRTLIDSAQVATAAPRSSPPTPAAGCESPAAQSCPTGSCGPSISARSSASCAASTASPKPCRECVPIRAADCGSTHPTTGCAALVIRHRFHPPARCSLTNCRSHRNLCLR